MLTAVLGVLAIGALVYAIGLEESREAATRAGSAASRGARSTAAAGVGGTVLGIQFGNDLVNAILAEPGFALAAVTGVFGSLGTGGYLGDLSGLQFLLIGVTVFFVLLIVFGGEN